VNVQVLIVDDDSLHPIQAIESRNVNAQVFFVADKANPGWSVVLKKEARGARISSTGVELALGQEESSGDRDVFTTMEGDRREAGDENDVAGGATPVRGQRRRRGQ
jgi:hypothetical protein